MRFSAAPATGTRARSDETASGFARIIVPSLIGLAAPILMALAWSPSGDWTPLQLVIRAYQLPVAFVELFAIGIALIEGLPRALGQWTWSRPVVAAAIVLIFVVVSTGLTALNKGAAVPLTIYWIVHGLFALSLAYLAGRTFEPADLVWALLAGFALFAVEFFLFLYAIPDWAAFDWTGNFMAFTHIRHVGYYVGAIAALGIGVTAVAKSRVEWLCGWVLGSLAFGMALWTGSRGAAFAVVGAILVGSAVAPALRAVRAWGAALAGMGLTLTVVWLAPGTPDHLMGLARAVRQTTGGNFTTGRTTIWRHTIAAIEQRPLFGYGEAQMHTVAPFYTMVHPHDLILQVTLAWGLVGLASAGVLMSAYAMRAVVAVRKGGGAFVPLFMSMVTVAILSLYDGSLYYALPQSIFFACGGAIASHWTSAENHGAEYPD